MKRMLIAMLLTTGASPSIAGTVEEDCYKIDMGGYFNLSLGCQRSPAGEPSGGRPAMSTPPDNGDGGGSGDGDDGCDHEGHDDDPVTDDGHDNNGHGNGDEGDCRGRGCQDDDNPGRGHRR